MNEEIIKDSFDDYIKSLVILKETVSALKGQTSRTNQAINDLLGSSHLNALLTMTKQPEFLKRTGRL